MLQQGMPIYSEPSPALHKACRLEELRFLYEANTTIGVNQRAPWHLMRCRPHKASRSIAVLGRVSPQFEETVTLVTSLADCSGATSTGGFPIEVCRSGMIRPLAQRGTACDEAALGGMT